MPFSDFHGDPETCLFVIRIELIWILKNCDAKTLMLKRKSGPGKLAKIWIKIPKKMTKTR